MPTPEPLSSRDLRHLLELAADVIKGTPEYGAVHYEGHEGLYISLVRELEREVEARFDA